MANEILDHESFLRRLPVGMPIKDALIIESIVFAFDGAMRSYKECYKRSSSIGEMELNTNDIYKAKYIMDDLLDNIWVFVDKVDLARQLFWHFLTRTLKYDEKYIGAPSKIQHMIFEFCQSLKDLRKIRNGMDHLPATIDNKYATRKTGVPVYGSCSFHWCSKDMLSDPNNILVNTFAFSEGNLGYGSDIPYRIPGGCEAAHAGAFGMLFWFDENVISLDEIKSKLCSTILYLSDVCERSILDAINSHCSLNGIDPSKLLSPRQPSVIVCTETLHTYDITTSSS